ncbi:MAG: O-methyltransferase [Anaeromicrobium sp.]|uniref:O-methyltransferase n=1 Tax=Anaeromicrobium sp. TaxID=1929132 RepID=UPI0025D5791A|nr:O-methyltransferase [Anaeromicrobium sp.]MCT4595051.1 O-methyltransferase [Anaeromicrobium sp.]
MSNIVNEVVEEYIRNNIKRYDGLLKEMEIYAEENHVPIVQPEVAKLLEVLVKIHKPKRILEVGTAIGYSSIVLCKDDDDRQIVTIERRADRVSEATNYIDKAGLKERIKIIEGSAEEVLEHVDGQFDMIFLDAAKGQYMNFLELSIDKLKSGGVLISDNVLYKGMIATDEYVVRRKKTIVKRMRTYIDYINKKDELTTCVIPIGDGVAISYKG